MKLADVDEAQETDPGLDIDLAVKKRTSRRGINLKKNSGTKEKKIEILYSMLPKEFVKILEMHINLFSDELYMNRSSEGREASMKEKAAVNSKYKGKVLIV